MLARYLWIYFLFRKANKEEREQILKDMSNYKNPSDETDDVCKIIIDI